MVMMNSFNLTLLGKHFLCPCIIFKSFMSVVHSMRPDQYIDAMSLDLACLMCAPD